MLDKERILAKAKAKGGKGFYILIAAVVVVGGFLLYNAGGSDEAPELTPISLAGGDIPADMSSGTAIGAEDAPVVIMEFSDF
ncbi:MAG: hypothetical protein M8861_01285, partial [marine benthic group bacterium]|nr:hypothetical protein [Gemmatimonadota bacterium]